MFIALSQVLNDIVSAARGRVFAGCAAAMAVALLAACSHNRYAPVDDNFNSLLAGRTAIDTLFVRAMAAPKADAVANYMASLLADSYHIYMARNGQEGLDKAQSIIPDLIITDIMMPVMDGMELLKQLRHSDLVSHLPVVMVTARAADADRIDGYAAGADAYLHKPFNADELRTVAANLIDQRRRLCEKYRNLATHLAPPDDTIDADSQAYIGRLIDVVYHLINNDRRTDIAEIASRMNTSERSLARKLQALTGESTIAFVNRIKIDKAKRLLDDDTSMLLADVALRCGFEDPAYFSRIFKQSVGMSPTAYRRRVK